MLLLTCLWYPCLPKTNVSASGQKPWTIVRRFDQFSLRTVYSSLVYRCYGAKIYTILSVFSRDILKGGNIGMLAGGRGVLGLYYLLENNSIIHYYYCQSEGGGRQQSRGGRFTPPPPPPLPRKYSAVIVSSNFEETKGYSPGFFFQGPKKCVEKSNPSESK